MAGGCGHAYPGILRVGVTIPPPAAPCLPAASPAPMRPVPPLCDDACVAYDEGLATRLLDVLGDEAGLAEKKMFGGLAILLDGNMAVGVYGDDLLVRTDPGQQDMLLSEPGTRPFDMTGRPMKGWIVVDASMCAEDDDLRRWVSRGVAHARSLPPK
jgi:TfoX/Sxy family transcriptional regulator of competence genes